MVKERKGGKEEKSLRIREPNTLIEAKQKMSRDEAILWLWNLVATKFFSDKNGKILSLEEVEEAKKRKELIYAVSRLDLNELREKFPNVFTKDKIKYLHKVLRSMQKKVVFEVKIEDYVQMLKDLGFEYLIDALQIPKNKEKVKYYAISTIMSMAVMEDGLQIVYSPYVAPLLLYLKKRFTTYDFSEVLNLNSRHSIILYRLFREKLGLRKYNFKLSIEELKIILNVEKMRTKDITEKILIPSIEEINQKTSLKVSFTPIRKGKGGKIVAFQFRVKKVLRLPISEEILNIEEVKELLSLIDILSVKKIVKKEDSKNINPFLPVDNDMVIEDFDYTSEEEEKFKIELTAYKLLSLKRVNPAIALWYLLHFPKEVHNKIWKKIKTVDSDKDKFKYPERFFTKEINDKREDLDFLLEERIKTIFPLLLEEIAKPYKEYLEYKTKIKEANLLVDQIKEIFSKLSKEQKFEVKKRLEVEFNHFGKISELVAKFWDKLDIDNLKKIKSIFEGIHLKSLDNLDDLL